jgi:hypothetical protein
MNIEEIKREFEAIFTIHDQTTLNKIMEFIGQKLQQERMKAIYECMAKLEDINKAVQGFIRDKDAIFVPIEAIKGLQKLRGGE